MQFHLNELDQYLSGLYERMELPGVAVCLMGHEGVVFEKGYGYRDADRQSAVDGDTMFGIASMSKSMTALCLAILETEGKLSLNDPVSRYFPSFRIPGTPRDAVTLRHLAMHTAGIPPIEPLEWSIAMNTPGRDSEWIRQMRASAPNRMDTIDQIIDYIAQGGYEPLGAPGEVMSYSNEGYAILSYVVDQAAGMPLEQFLEQRVFAPLGMTRSVLDVDAGRAREMAGGNLTSLFERENGQQVCDDFWSVLPPYRGCGLVKSTARDMARYYRCLSDGGRHEGRQVLPRRAVERLIGREFPETEAPCYCLGLNKRVMAGRVLCEHSGGLHGVSSYGGLVKGEGYGLSVLCNQGDEDVSPFLWTMFNLVLGLPLATSHRWSHPAGRDFSDPEMLLGTYRAREGVPADVTVALRQGRLMAFKEEVEMELVYCGGTLFMGFKPGDREKMLSRMTFYVRRGQAWGVQVGSRVFQRLSPAPDHQE